MGYHMPWEDIGPRPPQGVVVTLVDFDGKRCKILIDDVRNQPMLDGTSWCVDAPYTERIIDFEALKNLASGSEDFCMIGEAIIARLLALSRGKLPRERA